MMRDSSGKDTRPAQGWFERLRAWLFGPRQKVMNGDPNNNAENNGRASSMDDSREERNKSPGFFRSIVSAIIDFINQPLNAYNTLREDDDESEAEEDTEEVAVHSIDGTPRSIPPQKKAVPIPFVATHTFLRNQRLTSTNPLHAPESVPTAQLSHLLSEKSGAGSAPPAPEAPDGNHTVLEPITHAYNSRQPPWSVNAPRSNWAIGRAWTAFLQWLNEPVSAYSTLAEREREEEAVDMELFRAQERQRLAAAAISIASDNDNPNKNGVPDNITRAYAAQVGATAGSRDSVSSASPSVGNDENRTDSALRK